jgi:heptosyltransferase-1
MHSSVAVGTPTVGLCGASWWHGFQDYDNFELLREKMDCSPCVHRPTCDGRFDCMRALTPERVLAAVRRLRGSPLAVLK